MFRENKTLAEFSEIYKDWQIYLSPFPTEELPLKAL